MGSMQVTKLRVNREYAVRTPLDFAATLRPNPDGKNKPEKAFRSAGRLFFLFFIFYFYF